jgi:Leishmanolysin
MLQVRVFLGKYKKRSRYIILQLFSFSFFFLLIFIFVTFRAVIAADDVKAAAITAAASAYTISLSLTGDGMTLSKRQIFREASNRWSDVVIGDVPDISSYGLRKPIPDCTLPAIIDDLHICGEITEIDGPGQVLGQAGPTYFRRGSYLPVLGLMQFDSADVDSLINGNTFSAVILHEMGHVLGIGTVWKRNRVTTKGLFCQYRGINGNREYRALSGCARILPVETDGAYGTRCGHFDESCFQDELMTGYVNGATSLPLSRLTVATLEDIGYTVNYAEADPYTVADMNRNCVCKNSKKIRNRDLSIVKPIEILTNKTNSSMSGTKRMLSNEGLQHAIAHGKKYLLAARKRYHSNPAGTLSGLTSVGSDFISVIYKDGENGIFSVIVTLDDN